MDTPGADCWTPRDRNDLASSYTMADAVFSACFLNRCLAHCRTVGMAAFAPAVNTRGLLFTHDQGIVRRSTWHVFDLYANHMGQTVVDSWLEADGAFEAKARGRACSVPELDSAATVSDSDGSLRVSIANRSPDRAVALELEIGDSRFQGGVSVLTLGAGSRDSFNDVENPDSVSVAPGAAARVRPSAITVELPPHSVSVVSVAR